MNGDRLLQKFRGAMIGSALGDAIGEIVLYKAHRGFISQDDLQHLISKRDLKRLLKEFPEYKYTDDTAMAIGIAECLVAKHGIDFQYLGQRFHYNYNEE